MSHSQPHFIAWGECACVCDECAADVNGETVCVCSDCAHSYTP